MEFLPQCIVDTLYSSKCFPMLVLQDLSFLGVPQDVAVSQTGYITSKVSDYTFWGSQLIELLVILYYLIALRSICGVTPVALPLVLTANDGTIHASYICVFTAVVFWVIK